ncbi:MAG: hypothetical protein ACJ76N_14965 [Thermoanaerobaculia bacterium]
MKRSLMLAALLLGALFPLPASAQLQYFGYHASAEDDVSLNKVKGYTNFSYISSSADIYDTRMSSRVNAMAQAGVKAIVELGLVLWCDYDGSGSYQTLCWDWQQRWTNWKNYNAAILTPDKLLAMVVRDEPFNWNVSIDDVDAAAKKIKEDLATSHPTVKIMLLEADCVVAGEPCGNNPGSGAFDRYQGTLPHIDWIGLNGYAIHPETDPKYQLALSKIKSRFPDKKRIYVMDAWWSTLHQQAFGSIEAMAQVAQEWYRVAQSDPAAVALGAASWVDLGGLLGSKDFPCSVLQAHVAIGRAITGRTRGSAPIGTFSTDANGVLSGWACDPDQTLCEQNPTVNIYLDGVLNSSFTVAANDTFSNLQCGMSTAFRFKYSLPRSSAAKIVTVTGADGDSPGAQIPSSCAQSPACSWTPHLLYFGYVGAGDDDLGLNQTKGYTNFAQIAAIADLTSTFVRDRVTPMSQKGIKATIDLGKVLWCGSNYTYLCGDYVSRWTTWKQTNASILTADKVLAFAIRDQPFFNRVSIGSYETAARMVKADFPWAKLFLVEAACAVRGSCNGTSYTGFSEYIGTMPDVDWVGVAEYAIRYPTTNTSYQAAVQKLKNKFPGKKTLYVMDSYWDAAHAAVMGQPVLRSLAGEWYNVAHDDFDSVLLGAFVWSSAGSGTTTARSFDCNIMQAHVQVGREVTGKVRSQTGPPVGRLEGIYSGNVVGWACDPDGTVCESPQVQLYVGGSPYGYTSFPDRNDYVLSPQCGAGVAMRFRSSQAPSGYLITAVARDLDSTSTTTLPSNCLENPACIWYSSYSNAKGYMEDLQDTGVVTGWVCDPDAPHLATQVKLVANGTVIGIYTTSLGNEQAVAAECGGGYNHRFSVQLPAWTRGFPVEAYAVDLTSGDFLIPWLCSDPWTDYWSCTW